MYLVVRAACAALMKPAQKGKEVAAPGSGLKALSAGLLEWQWPMSIGVN
jgi:hypothetical protein